MGFSPFYKGILKVGFSQNQPFILAKADCIAYFSIRAKARSNSSMKIIELRFIGFY